MVALVAGLSINLKAEKVKTGELKSAASLSLSMEEEMELLQEYFPVLNKEGQLKERVQIYNSSFELIIEGDVNLLGEIENEELAKYLDNSNFLMSVDDKSIYVIEN